MQEGTMRVDEALNAHPFRPKGIKVGSEVWKALNADGRITWKRGYLEGAIDSEIDFPVLDEDIFVRIDPELDDLEVSLPPRR